MPPVICECGAGRGYGHAEGCSWRREGRPDPMLVRCPHPGCGALPGEPCARRKTSGVHMARERQHLNSEAQAIGLGLRLGGVLSAIAERGRAGPHDENDPECGCGRCCAMLVHGIVAGVEGLLASRGSIT